MQPPLFDGLDYIYWRKKKERNEHILDVSWTRCLECNRNKMDTSTTNRNCYNIDKNFKYGGYNEFNRNQWWCDRLKPKFGCTGREKAASNENTKALHFIFNRVEKIQFKMIANRTTTKEARDALETTFKGSEDIWTMKQQCIKTMFDGLKMTNDENISDIMQDLRMWLIKHSSVMENQRNKISI